MPLMAVSALIPSSSTPFSAGIIVNPLARYASISHTWKGGTVDGARLSIGTQWYAESLQNKYIFALRCRPGINAEPLCDLISQSCTEKQLCWSAVELQSSSVLLLSGEFCINLIPTKKWYALLRVTLMHKLTFCETRACHVHFIWTNVTNNRHTCHITQINPPIHLPYPRTLRRVLIEGSARSCPWWSCDRRVCKVQR